MSSDGPTSTQSHSRQAGDDTARRFWSGSVHEFAAEALFNNFYDKRVALAARMIEELGSSLHVLDVGCGSGQLVARLAHVGHRVVGLDLSEAQLIRARVACGKSPVDLREGGLEALRANEQFDSVFALGVVPYAADQPEFVADLARRVGVRGRLIVSITRPLSLYTLVALARHVRSFQLTADWAWIARNLMRTGIWSGGFIPRDDLIPVRSLGRLDRVLHPFGFRRIGHFSLFNVNAFDKTPDARHLLASWASDRLGWCTVAAYTREQ